MSTDAWGRLWNDKGKKEGEKGKGKENDIAKEDRDKKELQLVKEKKDKEKKSKGKEDKKQWLRKQLSPREQPRSSILESLRTSLQFPKRKENTSLDIRPRTLSTPVPYLPRSESLEEELALDIPPSPTTPPTAESEALISHKEKVKSNYELLDIYIKKAAEERKQQGEERKQAKAQRSVAYKPSELYHKAEGDSCSIEASFIDPKENTLPLSPIRAHRRHGSEHNSHPMHLNLKACDFEDLHGDLGPRSATTSPRDITPTSILFTEATRAVRSHNCTPQSSSGALDGASYTTPHTTGAPKYPISPPTSISFQDNEPLHSTNTTILHNHEPDLSRIHKPSPEFPFEPRVDSALSTPRSRPRTNSDAQESSTTSPYNEENSEKRGHLQSQDRHVHFFDYDESSRAVRLSAESSDYSDAPKVPNHSRSSNHAKYEELNDSPEQERHKHGSHNRHSPRHRLTRTHIKKKSTKLGLLGFELEKDPTKKRILIILGAGISILRSNPKFTPQFGSLAVPTFSHQIKDYAAQLELEVGILSTNSESQIIDGLCEAQGRLGIDGCVINPGTFTHGYQALMASLQLVNFPVVEVHEFNTSLHKFTSEVSQYCVATITGCGYFGYFLAFQALIRCVETRNAIN